jgi:hypothetical protein
MQLIGSRIVSKTATTKQSAAQVPFARKAVKLKAARGALRAARAKAKQTASNGKRKRVVDLADVHNRLANRVGLLDKREVLAIVGCTYPALWEWQRAGKFPLARVVFGKSKWPAAVVADWLDGLPLRPLKGDAPPDQKIEEHEPA